MQLDSSIFIVGPHRSGTTLLYSILSRHPELGYLNRMNKRFPANPILAHVLTRLAGKDRPMEAQTVWDRFKTGDTDVMAADDASPKVCSWFRGLVHKVLLLRKADAFIAKYPRLSLRIEWLDAIFPQAKFVHLTRDWRAVLNSSLKLKLKRLHKSGKWFGVHIPGWREMQDISPEEAVSRQFRYVSAYLEDMAAKYKDRFVHIAYEDLCAEPLGTIKRITEFCNLSWSPEFEGSVPRDLVSSNYKWRENIKPETIDQIRKMDEEFFRRYEEA